MGDRKVKHHVRIGFGFDVHRLESGHPFNLGGIQIAAPKGATGHSDADVLIHAICDALLGAVNLGDIGMYFPDNDPAYKGVDSKKLLKKVMEMIRKQDYEIGNIDSTVCLQQPKLRPYVPAMQQALAHALHIPDAVVSIKATTTEQLGFTGREEGVAAYAVVLLEAV